MTDPMRASSHDATSTPSLGGAARRVTLLCPEPLRASACCVEDALVARGWRVRLEFGAQARRVLLRPARSDARELRVLCTAEPLDSDVEAQLRLGVDPDGRGDFQIVVFDTPRAVIEAVERMGGATTRRRRLAPRRGRTYLQHPTLVEQQVHDDRARRWGIATAVAVAIAAVAAIEARPRTTDPVDAPIVRRADEVREVREVREADTNAPARVDDPVLAAVNTALPIDDDVEADEPIVIEDDAPAPAHERTLRRGASEFASPRAEPVADDFAPLEPAPVEAATSPAPNPARAAAPGVVVPASPLEHRPKPRAIDPFADGARSGKSP